MIRSRSAGSRSYFLTLDCVFDRDIYFISFSILAEVGVLLRVIQDSGHRLLQGAATIFGSLKAAGRTCDRGAKVLNSIIIW